MQKHVLDTTTRLVVKETDMGDGDGVGGREGSPVDTEIGNEAVSPA